jgi:HSP20 family protein
MFEKRISAFPFMGWQHPFTEMERISRQMDRLTHALFGRSGLSLSPARVFPAVNITEDNDQYYIRAELPGIKSDEIDLQVTGKNLSISGERKIRVHDENTKYHRREREAGKFSRVIELPGEINPDKVTAKMDNGMLTVIIAKSEVSRPKQIAVS